jgi:hypothetical protein
MEHSLKTKSLLNIEDKNESSDDGDDEEEETTFEKIVFDTEHKVTKSLDEPPTDLVLKPLPKHLEYAFLEEESLLPVIISSKLSERKKLKLISILKNHKRAFAWKTSDIPGICPSFCNHKIQLLDDKKPVVQKQRRLNPNMKEVVKKEIVKLLQSGIIYPIADSPWVSPIMCQRKVVSQSYKMKMMNLFQLELSLVGADVLTLEN